MAKLSEREEQKESEDYWHQRYLESAAKIQKIEEGLLAKSAKKSKRKADILSESIEAWNEVERMRLGALTEKQRVNTRSMIEAKANLDRIKQELLDVEKETNKILNLVANSQGAED